MTKTCSECGTLFSAYNPVQKGNRLLICVNCLRVVCANCASKSRNRNKCVNKKCRGKLRELELEELY